MTDSRRLRLDRLLANLGYGSRREVQSLVLSGRVRLDGRTLSDPEVRLEAGEDLPQRMTVGGEPLDPLFPLVVIMNKPTGVVCSHRDQGERVYDLLPARWRRRTPALSSIGRLDKDTSGLLLLTDDGTLLHQVISPKKNIWKRYIAELELPLRGCEGRIFASGDLLLEGEDSPLLPARLEPLSGRRAALTIREGRFHQVRRMFASQGNRVVSLHRESIGGLILPPDLAPGAFRPLGTAETGRIFEPASEL